MLINPNSIPFNGKNQIKTDETYIININDNKMNPHEAHQKLQLIPDTKFFNIFFIILQLYYTEYQSIH